MKKLLFTVVALMATMTLSAQDATTAYNEAAAAYGAKDFKTAVEKFNKVIELGGDEASAEELVDKAKKYLPKCYFQLGGAAVRAKNTDEALNLFTKSAELATECGDAAQAAKANGWISKVYQTKGGEAYNAKDYATAAEIFAKGYAADPDNTKLANFLAMSYCELKDFDKGMEIYESVASKTHPKYADDAAEAKKMMAMYTNNRVAEMQAAGDYDGIIAMADTYLEKNPANALFQKVRLQAYSGKKDYAKVIELGAAAAEAQTDEEDASLMYYTLGAAYNAKEMKAQAIDAFKKVTAGAAADNAKAALAELTK